MKSILVLTLMLVSGAARAESDPVLEMQERMARAEQLDILNMSTWHLLTITYGGTVSLIKGLTKTECEAARNKIGTHTCWSSDGNAGCTQWLGEGAIKSAECFE